VANKYTKKGRDAEPVSDQFVSFWDKAWEAVTPHLTRIAIVVAAAFALFGIMQAAFYYRDSGRQESTEMLGRVLKIHEAELLGDSEKAKADDELPRFKTAKERNEAILTELDKLAKAHPSSGAAREARVLRAGVLFDLGRVDEARAEWTRLSGEAQRGDPLGLIAREGEGIALETSGKGDDAIAIFKELEVRGGEFYRDRARLDVARVLVRQGKKDDATKIYKEMIGKVPTGPLHDEVQTRLSALGG
jgi:hypothetical protein